MSPATSLPLTNMQSMGIWGVLIIRLDCTVLHEERQSSLDA